jgi:hypothetical protein
MKQRGAALAVALILLVVLTLLAVSGMGMATAELAMVGNEQLRRRASDAASAGIERQLADRSGWRYVGDEAVLPGFSAEKFIGRHYVIESVGEAPRGARDVQVQGVLVISPKGSEP